MKNIPVYLFRYSVYLILVAFIGLISIDSALAQRVTYESLKARDRIPTAYFDYNILPPVSVGDNPRLIVSFKIEHNFLNFRTINQNRSTDYRFSADVEIGIDVFQINDPDMSPTDHQELFSDQVRNNPNFRRTNQSSARRNHTPQQAVSRDFWNGTAFAETYEQTQSSHQYLEGFMVKDLPPGDYEIITRFSSNQQSRNANPRRVRIPDFSGSKQAQIYFLDQTREISIPSEETLINMGRNVYYGKDFNSLIMIPAFDDQAEYRLQLHRVDERRRDASPTETVFDEILNERNIYHGIDVQLTGDGKDAVIFNLTDQGTDHTFGLKHIPNSRFENANYRMELWKTDSNGERSLVGNRMFMNRWVDIPSSLLNVDVAIDMLRFIVDDRKLSELKRGNERQRERRFREFWAERNPTPETEYNELMVEYYRRIDYAFENFTSPRKPGYESDMGKVYIQNGEPRNIIRRLPPNQPAEQIWEYGSRSFIFVATSGFGEYELRETKAN